MLKNKTKAKGKSKKAKVKNKALVRYFCGYFEFILFLPFAFRLLPFALDFSCRPPSAVHRKPRTAHD
jgi:hypothetical protein